MRYILLMFIFLLSGMGLRAQVLTTDSLYEQYPDIYVGPFISLESDMIQFNYSYYDTLEKTFVSAGSKERRLKSQGQGGLSISTKYLGFNVTFGAVKEWFATKGEVKTSTTAYTSFSVPFYFESVYLTAGYTGIKGMHGKAALRQDSFGTVKTGDTIFSDVRTRKYYIQGTYFFKRKNEMGRATSFLWMPTRTLFSFGLKSFATYNTFKSDSTSFLETTVIPWNGRTDRLWDYANSFQYFAMAVAPGFNLFAINKKFKNGKTRNFRIFYNMEFYIGPSFFSNKMNCIETRNNAEKVGAGLYVVTAQRYGISTRRFVFEVRANLSVYSVSNEHLSAWPVNSTTTINIGYRIPFERGYKKIDAKIEKIKGKKSSP